MELSPGQLLTLSCPTGIRVWRVTGIYLGSERSEDIVGLASVDKEFGSVDGETVREMVVPYDLLRWTTGLTVVIS